MRMHSTRIPIESTLLEKAQPDSWDLEMLGALGFDSDESETSLPVPASPEESRLIREARYHVRAHMAKVIKALVRELDRMYRSRFGADTPPLSWKVIRTAATATRLDAGKADIKKAEAGRIFLRNTLRKKLAEVELDEGKFFQAVDVTSPEWKGQARRGEVCFGEEECYMPFATVAELLARLDEIVLPDTLLKMFADSKEVIRKTEPIVLRDAERAIERLASSHLAGPDSKKRYTAKRVYKPSRGGLKREGEVSAGAPVQLEEEVKEERGRI